MIEQTLIGAAKQQGKDRVAVARPAFSGI